MASMIIANTIGGRRWEIVVMAQRVRVVHEVLMLGYSIGVNSGQVVVVVITV
jgi:hypothetical protein